MKFIKPSQHIVITPETELGKKCNVIKILEDTLIKNGFTKTIWEKNVSNLGDEEFYNTIVGNQKVLNKKM